MAWAEARPRTLGRGWILLGRVGVLCGQHWPQVLLLGACSDTQMSDRGNYYRSRYL